MNGISRPVFQDAIPMYYTDDDTVLGGKTYNSDAFYVNLDSIRIRLAGN
nr:hypothetical protein [uncultured Fluviicola sp.]